MKRRKTLSITAFVVIIGMLFISCTRFEGRELKTESGKELSIISINDYYVGVDENDSLLYLLPKKQNIVIRYRIIEYDEANQMIESMDFVRTNDAYVTISESEEEENLVYLRPFLPNDSYEFNDTADYWLYIIEAIDTDNGLDRDILRIKENYRNIIFDDFLDTNEK